MTLKDVAVGRYATVKSLDFSGVMKRKLLDMGITKGTSILVVKAAPFGDPLELNLRGYSLTMRKIDASHIEVE